MITFVLETNEFILIFICFAIYPDSLSLVFFMVEIDLYKLSCFDTGMPEYMCVRR